MADLPAHGAKACTGCWVWMSPRTRSAACRTSIGEPGAFGYFPSYALGCLIAAQLWEAIEAELGTLEESLRNGDVASIRAGSRSGCTATDDGLDTMPPGRAATGRTLEMEPFCAT